jgi:hypothetical protein
VATTGTWTDTKTAGAAANSAYAAVIPDAVSEAAVAANLAGGRDGARA